MIDVQAARATLRHRLSYMDLFRPDPLLVTRDRARRRLQVENLERDLLAEQLEQLAALPDADLEWLLAMGWDPSDHQRVPL